MALQGQVNAILAQQGATPIEADLLTSPVVEHDAAGGGTSETYRVRLASGTIAFHKPFTGVDVVLADDFGHEDPDQVPVNEAAAWRLAAALGTPVSRLVCVCVLRTIAYEPGSLSLRVPGEPWSVCDGRQAGLSEIPFQAGAAAFFDSLVAQQDRHNGNFFFDGETLGLIDHGFTSRGPATTSTTRTSWSGATTTATRRSRPGSTPRSTACSRAGICSGCARCSSPTARPRSKTAPSGSRSVGESFDRGDTDAC
jgi:hypothetical protein